MSLYFTIALFMHFYLLVIGKRKLVFDVWLYGAFKYY